MNEEYEEWLWEKTLEGRPELGLADIPDLVRNVQFLDLDLGIEYGGWEEVERAIKNGTYDPLRPRSLRDE